MRHAQEFDQKVALEAVLYLAEKSSDPTFHHIFKLLYFADLMHVKEYGRFICGDRYVAMKNGPVPSAVYDMVKDVKFDARHPRCPEAKNAFAVVGEHTVKPLRPADQGWFSRSDLICMDESLRLYDKFSFPELTHKSHDSAWHAADVDDFIPVEAIVKRVGSPDGLLEHLVDPHP